MGRYDGTLRRIERRAGTVRTGADVSLSSWRPVFRAVGCPTNRTSSGAGARGARPRKGYGWTARTGWRSPPRYITSNSLSTASSVSLICQLACCPVVRGDRGPIVLLGGAIVSLVLMALYLARWWALGIVLSSRLAYYAVQEVTAA